MISKKKLKQISQISVMDSVLRETLKDDYFADVPPDNWDDNEKLIYDMLAEVEYKILAKVKEILIPEKR